MRKLMEILFLGTSALPSISRNSSCVLFKLGSLMHVFDCGEGSYRQFQNTTYRGHKISSIFITHMHGDHMWGLPGFLSAATFNRVAEIYGPPGLRDWLRMALTAGRARVPSKYQVNELILSEEKTLERVASLRILDDPHEDELPGYDISCSGDGLWHVLQKDDYEVEAGLLSHNIPCWGFVLKERVGQRCWNLSIGNREDASEADGGRKVVILGDTFNSDSLLTSAKDADVLIHEATFLRTNEADNHSTPEMAGTFARSINARCLVLTHLNRLIDIPKFERQAVQAAKRQFKKDSVLLAKDFMALKVS